MQTRGQQETLALPLVPVVGEVAVGATPAAEVRVDRSDGDPGPADARTPATLRLRPGRHSLELRAPGHRSERHELVVVAHERQALERVLEPIPQASGTLAVRASEPAMVLVDGQERGVTPTILTVGVGVRQVELRHPDFAPWRQEVEVREGVQQFLDVSLRPPEPEVVGATRTIQTLGEAPASVSLVSAAEIEALGYVQLADALRGVRGLYDSYDRTYRYTGIRGFSRPGDYTSRVLVLRDGHVVNDDWVGQGSVGREFAADLDDVARIEVVRGPGSAFYGQGAFFGVVNVVSRPAGAGPGLRTSAAASSDGGVRMHARAAATPSARTGLTIAGSIYRSQGESHEFPGVYPGFARDTDGETVSSLALRGRAGDFQLDAEWNRREKQIPTAQFDSIFDPVHAGPGVASSQLDERLFVEARWQRTLASAALGARLYYDHFGYRGIYPYEEALFREDARGDAAGADTRVAFDVPGRQRLTLGAELVGHVVDQSYDEDMDGSDDLPDPEHRFVTASLYLVDELSVSPRLRFTAGARLDRAGPDALMSLSPRIAAVATPYPSGRSKLIVGRAFRAPSVYQLYYHDGGVTQKVPEGGLAAETIVTVDLEHTHQLGERTVLIGSLFGSRIDELIGLVVDPADGLLVYANSTDRVWAAGAELETRRSWRSGAWIAGALSLTRLDTDDPEVRTNTTPVIASLRGFWPVERSTLGLGGELVYNSPRPDRAGGETEHSFLVNLVATVPAGASGVRVRVGVYNLLDQRYGVPVGGDFKQVTIAQDGRSFMAEVSYER